MDAAPVGGADEGMEGLTVGCCQFRSCAHESTLTHPGEARANAETTQDTLPSGCLVCENAGGVRGCSHVRGSRSPELLVLVSRCRRRHRSKAAKHGCDARGLVGARHASRTAYLPSSKVAKLERVVVLLMIVLGGALGGGNSDTFRYPSVQTWSDVVHGWRLAKRSGSCSPFEEACVGAE